MWLKVVEFLPSKLETQSSNPSTTGKDREGGRDGERERESMKGSD
jgi:hypothetical protein